MSTPNAHPPANILAAQPDAPVARVQHANLAAIWRERFFSPLWFCLLVALGLRIFLVVHTHGIIDGDEALIGIQAERILHGDFPVYFYGQAYMGSLEAYLIAILFALFGSSVWTLRSEPVLLSLAVVWLTWRLARTLTETTSLSRSTRRIFMTVAALCAAIPPLYDGIIEGRTYGGFIEMLVVILLLLISTIRLTRRWFNGASRGELAWRWAGIGFLVGLGFWIYPLIASAVLAAGLWIPGRCLLEMRQRYTQTGPGTAGGWWQPVRDLCLAPVAIPACLLGMAPAIGWGTTHQWANLRYIFGLSGHGTLHQRLSNIFEVTNSFGSCVSPRVIGGAIPLESQLSSSIHLFLFIFGLICVVVTLLLLILACLQPTARLAPVCQMAGLPTLFALFCVLLFCVSSASEAELLGCTNDWAGRYAAPLMLAFPFFFATAFTMGWVFLCTRNASTHSQARPTVRAGQSLLLLLLLGFLGLHALAYGLADPGEVYQSNYCVQDPFDNGPVLTYLQEQHIHYFWANNMLAYPLVFESHLSIVGADPLPLLHPTIAINRIPSYISAVLHANRPGMLFLIPRDDARPKILRALDNLHETYRTARFYAQPGYDVLIVMPLSRTVSPLESPQLDLFRCVSQ
ncbi:MAG TPA: hypothetical protein VF026_33795 [Ktedonobacteraceae bacterium]